MNEELEKYEVVRDQLMDEFIKDISPWINWDEISGFEERMARDAIRKLIIYSYREGAMECMQKLNSALKAGEGF